MIAKGFFSIFGTSVLIAPSQNKTIVALLPRLYNSDNLNRYFYDAKLSCYLIFLRKVSKFWTFPFYPVIRCGIIFLKASMQFNFA